MIHSIFGRTTKGGETFFLVGDLGKNKRGFGEGAWINKRKTFFWLGGGWGSKLKKLYFFFTFLS